MLVGDYKTIKIDIGAKILDGDAFNKMKEEKTSQAISFNKLLSNYLYLFQLEDDELMKALFRNFVIN